MKMLVFTIAALCLAGCTSPSSSIEIEKLQSFGDRLPGTIHVMALQGV